MDQKTKRRLVLGAKLAVAIGIWVGIYVKVSGRENAEELFERLSAIDWTWIPVAAAAQMAAIVCATVRWRQLLVGQGIFPSFRHLFGSLMVGRFFGALTPGGLGFQGYRIYDIAAHTGKNARATATIAIELLAGQMGFAATVLLGSFFGLEHLGVTNVLMIDGLFVGLLVVSGLLVVRPFLFRKLASIFLGNVPTKIQTLVDGVCAYQGQGRLVAQAIGLSMLVHVFNNFIYVGAARALGMEVTTGQIFFVSSLQIFATLMPVSINGVGLREAAALYVYTTFFGVPQIVALLTPILGFAVEMVISSVGGLVLLARGSSYKPEIRVEDEGREERIAATVVAREVEKPEVLEGALLGLSGGAVGGLLAGAAEGAFVVYDTATNPDWGVLAYGGLVYAVIFGLLGFLGGGVLAWLGRLIHKPKLQSGEAFARFAGIVLFVLAAALGIFLAWRDVFHKSFALKSGPGILLILGGATAAGALALAAYGLFRVLARREGSLLARPLGGLSLAGGLLLALVGVAFVMSPSFEDGDDDAEGVMRGPGKNVILIVVDTLRADALPSYGYAQGKTPSLDAFTRDAVRYDQFFANASWTRPSFASILTGRYPSNHRVMSQDSMLPDEVTTLAEAFREGGYSTSGIVTNFNVSSRYNFQQGFDRYAYLEPRSPLGANEAGMRLMALQVIKRIVGKLLGERPGEAYIDAEEVNEAVLPELDRLAKQERPFFLFLGYMDPHDPYFAHPYGEPGYSKAGHQEPLPEEAPRLRGLYDGEVTYWDEHFGKLLDALRERGLYDESIIVVTSDHGEEFMDHGGYWHGVTLYDEQVRVPLFVKRAYQAGGGSVVSHWAQSVDLMPTLLGMNGLPAVKGVQGGLLDHGSDEVFAEEDHEGNVLRALRKRDESGEWKWIRANEGNPRGLDAEELYRVDRDPLEQENLAKREASRARALDRDLTEAEKRYSEGAAREQIREDMDPAECQRLLALGYVESCE
jgi:arylsulfatase A-like enzyme/uncharacterized membrane protein YbhN (UPF0104 family)